MQFVLDERDLLVLTAETSAEGVVPGAHLVPVRRQVMAERVARAVEPASLTDAESWRRASAELVKLLPAPVLAQMSAARTVVVIPDDMLWRVPFEALPSGAGYLGDQAAILYAPSITSLVRAPRLAPAASDLKVVVAARPRFRRPSWRP